MNPKLKQLEKAVKDLEKLIKLVIKRQDSLERALTHTSTLVISLCEALGLPKSAVKKLIDQSIKDSEILEITRMFKKRRGK